MPDQTPEERKWDEVYGRSPETFDELVSMLKKVMAQDDDVTLKFIPGSDGDCELLGDLEKVQSSNASLRARVEELEKELLEANELLRSAYSIASRQGAQTNWEAASRQFMLALERQLPILREQILTRGEDALRSLEAKKEEE